MSKEYHSILRWLELKGDKSPKVTQSNMKELGVYTRRRINELQFMDRYSAYRELVFIATGEMDD